MFVHLPVSERARQRTQAQSAAGPGAPIPRGLRLAKPQLISLTTLAIIFTVIINHPSPLLSCPLLSPLPLPPPSLRPGPHFILPPPQHRAGSPLLLSRASAFALGLQRRDNANGG